MQWRLVEQGQTGHHGRLAYYPVNLAEMVRGYCGRNPALRMAKM